MHVAVLAGLPALVVDPGPVTGSEDGSGGWRTLRVLAARWR